MPAVAIFYYFSLFMKRLNFLFEMKTLKQAN